MQVSSLDLDRLQQVQGHQSNRFLGDVILDSFNNASKDEQTF